MFYRRQLETILERIDKHPDAAYMDNRANYYNKISTPFRVDSVKLGEFKVVKPSTYFFDALRYLRYFSPQLSIAYQFGDVTRIPASPTIVKSRPIDGDNQNAVLMKLNQIRHFHFVHDRIPFEQKKDKMVWRGAAYRRKRRSMVQECYDNDLCDIGQTNKPPEDVPWQKGFMSIAEQLQFKFILCVEGNDVATSLKWIMSSNSLCMMPRPAYETWFMEGKLVADHHYVLLKDDFSDLTDKIRYYAEHTEEALAIIHNAQQHVGQFQDRSREDGISLLVLKKYFEQSNQPIGV